MVKIEQGPPPRPAFQTITITIESQEELEMFLALFRFRTILEEVAKGFNYALSESEFQTAMKTFRDNNGQIYDELVKYKKQDC